MNQEPEYSTSQELLTHLQDCGIVPPPAAGPPPEGEEGEAPPRSPCAEEKPLSGKKRTGRVWDVVFYLSLLALVVGMLLVKSGGGGAPVSMMGFSIHNVLTSSMQDVYPKGSLVLTRQVDPQTLAIGDDITYMKSETVTVTHRIVGITENYQETGQRAFQTQGIMNPLPDAEPVPAANVVGKVMFHSYPMGIAMGFLARYWHFVLLFLFLFIGLFGAVHSWWKAGREEAGAGQP